MNNPKTTVLDVNQYDRTVIAFSGGKDSLACVLWAVQNNCPNIELWHHLVDGREGSTLMDWPVTEDYCRKVSEHLGIPLYFSWLEGGLEREMNRVESRKAPTWFETPTCLEKAGGNGGKNNTRKKFPQVSPDLRVRWCSAYGKIDVATMAISNQARFKHSKTLVITGERAQESAARAKYKMFEPDRADRRTSERLKRHVDRLRPVLGWDEAKVWQTIKSAGIVPHVAYQLGLGRLSCLNCIFASWDQWATIREIAPSHFQKMVAYEKEFAAYHQEPGSENSYTLRRDGSLEEAADKGIVYPAARKNPTLVKVGLSTEWTLPIHTPDWKLPPGAFGENAGPT